MDPAISAAIHKAADSASSTLQEPWLYCDGTLIPCDAKPLLITDAVELETRLSFPATLYALVQGGTRTLGIVGTEDLGYSIADMQADNFPEGPIVRGFKTVAAVVEYIVRNAPASEWALEFVSTAPAVETTSTVAASAAAAAAKPAAKKRIKTEPAK